MKSIIFLIFLQISPSIAQINLDFLNNPESSRKTVGSKSLKREVHYNTSAFDRRNELLALSNFFYLNKSTFSSRVFLLSNSTALLEIFISKHFILESTYLITENKNKGPVPVAGKVRVF